MTDKTADINTGGGGYVSGDVRAAGDVHLGAKIVHGDEVHGDQITQMPWAPLPAYNPPTPAAPGRLPDPAPLPPGHRLPYGRNPLFTGREEDLLALADLLLPPPEKRRPGASTAIIATGIGGIGKTQLAIEFAHRYGQYFQGVHWISMENPDVVATEIALCGAEMRLRPDFDTLPAEAQTREMLAAWAGPAARLLIFDNCEDPHLLGKWRPASGGAQVLVTSRSTVWPVEYGAAVRPVQPLLRAQSRELLGEYLAPAGRQESDEALERVAAAVGDLPLALALAGHYLARYPKEGVGDYLAAWRDAAELLPVGRGAVSLTGHDLSLRRTFAVSFDRLAAADPVDAAARALLARAACFAPGEPLPAGLLLAALARGEGQREGEGQPPVSPDPHLPDDALLRLLELGLLERAAALLPLSALRPGP
ncbi:MAG: hypothetical protein KA170_14965, partial [Candidatus Promineofilum sp.]|nr:hypothetical protein [Promineifilum sp.]